MAGMVKRPHPRGLCLIYALSMIVLLSGLAAQNAWSQQSTASLNGTILDNTGGAVPGATVVLTNTKTGVKQTTVTTDTGRYVFLNVLPGDYTLEVTKEGFAPVKQESFNLEVNQTATFNFTLSLGATRQTVTVEAAPAQVESTTAELGTAITQTFVNELPLNGRQFTQLLSLTPGADPVSVAQNSGGGQSNPLGEVIIPAVNGQQNRSNYFMLDGINDSEVVFSSFAVAPIVDDIMEFKVQSHNDEAAFGYVTGGIVNVVSKTGTNAFHGTAWEFLRNNDLDARNPFAANTISLRQNQFGANIGGPVRLPHYDGRNRTFFFGSYEGFRNVTGAGLSGLAIAPTAAELGGDLSSLGLTPIIYNPYSTRPNPADPTQEIRDPFMCDASGDPLPVLAGNLQAAGTPCNKIPSALIDQNMVNYAKAVFPAPGPIVFAPYNTFSTLENTTSQNQINVRIDEDLNPSNTFWFRWSASYQNRVGPGGFQGLDNYGSTDAKNFGINYLHTFSPTTILTVAYGHNALTNASNTFFGGQYASDAAKAALDSSLGFASTFTCGYKQWGASFDCLIPSMGINGFISGGEGTGGATPLTSINEGKADFSKIKGNHTIKAGVDMQWQYFYSLSTGTSATFAAIETGAPALPGTGSPLASFLLGVVDSASRRSTLTEIQNQLTSGAYLEDQWKVTHRLTVNVGLRYEIGVWPIYGVDKGGTNVLGELDMSTGNYILQKSVGSCAVLLAAPCIPGGLPQPHIVVSPTGKLWDTPTRNFAPRLGLAYGLNNKTSLRASFGIFYDELAGINQTVQGIGGDWPSQTQALASNLNAATSGPPTVFAENPFAGVVAALPPPTPFDQVEWYRDPNQKNAYSEQWMMGVERQITSNTLLEADYVGSHSSRLTVGTFGNVALTPGPGNPLDRSLYNYITPSYYDKSVGRSDYDSFQFKFDHHASHGLEYLVSYTWAKSMDVGCSGYFSVEGCSVQDPWNLNGSRSVSAFDLPQVLSVSLLYHVPHLRTGNRLVNYGVGNWAIATILTATSGVPYDIGISGDIANTGNAGCCSYGYERLDVVGDPKLSNPSPSEWFNPAAFQAPAEYTFGNLGRDALRADRSTNLDLSFMREFPVTEQKRFQFRADMFNFPNHPVWGTPGETFATPTFDEVTGTRSTERQIQFALKFYF